MTDRYDTSGNPEAQFESGSGEKVLANKLGITDPAEMADVELDLLVQLYDSVIRSVHDDQRISAADLCVLIHPFREGNGRLSRLLANIMGLQAGRPDLDFTSWDMDKAGYFSAIQSGLDDYEPMKQLIRRVLRESAQNAAD